MRGAPGRSRSWSLLGGASGPAEDSDGALPAVPNRCARRRASRARTCRARGETTSTATARPTPARRRRADNDERASRPAACTSRRPARRAPFRLQCGDGAGCPRRTATTCNRDDADTCDVPATRPRARSRTDRNRVLRFWRTWPVRRNLI